MSRLSSSISADISEFIVFLLKKRQKADFLKLDDLCVWCNSRVSESGKNKKDIAEFPSKYNWLFLWVGLF